VYLLSGRLEICTEVKDLYYIHERQTQKEKEEEKNMAAGTRKGTNNHPPPQRGLSNSHIKPQSNLLGRHSGHRPEVALAAPT
jgi:hypothetical protein